MALDSDEVQRLWNWILIRQGLHPEHKLPSVASIASATVGIHSARRPTPFVSIAIRARQPEIALSLLRDAKEGLTTIRCMRRTLHLLPLPLAVAAHRATLHYRERDAQRALEKLGVDNDGLTELLRRLNDCLSGGPLGPRQIEATLACDRFTVPEIRAALKLAWEQGSLTYDNHATAWNQEVRRFALTSSMRPAMTSRMERAQATGILIGAYFDRYGPATIGDAMWWSSLSHRAVLTAMQYSQGPWMELHGPWASAPMYMPSGRFAEFLSYCRASRAQSGLNLMAHEDSALKAYFETRARYLGALPQKAAFNAIGEALPTVLFNGRVIGRWSWVPRTHAVRLALLPGSAHSLRRQAAAAAAALSETLRLGYSEEAGSQPTRTESHHPEPTGRGRIGQLHEQVAYG